MLYVYIHLMTSTYKLITYTYIGKNTQINNINKVETKKEMTFQTFQKQYV